jgi:hypothetical protein
MSDKQGFWLGIGIWVGLPITLIAIGNWQITLWILETIFGVIFGTIFEIGATLLCWFAILIFLGGICWIVGKVSGDN